MTALALDKIDIQGFRGLATPLSVDLKSPLTVLYAPNGTGKTTICDAAEWVITGKVARLCVGQSFDEAILRPKFDSSQTTEVTAHLRINGTALRLRRRMGQLLVAESDDDWRSVNLSELLEKLAPEGAGRAHHKRTIHQRQEYMRGTRFLSSDTLAILLDPDAIDRRQEIFSDLLGTRHLLEAENQLEKVEAALQRDERQLAASLDGVIGELDELERAGLAAPEVPARASIETAEQLLNLPLSDVALETRLQHVAGEIAGQRQRLAHRRSNIAILRVQIPQLADLQRSADEAEGGRKIAEGTVAGLRVELVQLQEKAAALAAQRQGLEARITALSESREQFRVTSSTLLVQQRRTLNGRPDQLPLSQWFARVSEWELSPDARQEQRNAVQKLLSALPHYRLQKADLELRRNKLTASTMALTDDAALPAAQDKARQIETQLRDLRRQLEVKAEPLQRLQMLARDIAAREAHATECPACGHDWETTALLRRALEEISERTPAPLAGLESEISSLAEQLAAQKAIVEETAERAEANRVLGAEVANLLAACSTFEQNASRWLPNAMSADAHDGLNNFLMRFDLAEALSSFDAARQLAQRYVTFDTQRRLEDTGPSVLSSLSNLISASSSTLGELNASLDATILQVQEATEGISAAEAAARAYETQEVQARSRLVALIQGWSALGVGEPISAEALEQAAVQDEHAEASLQKAEIAAEAARAGAELEARLVVASRKRRQKEEVASGLENVRAQLGSIGSALLAFRTHAAAESMSRIQGLTASVNAIFSRLHSNRVIDEISLGDATLYWAGGCGEERIEPPEFSHGQRQDLALALFLARARSIGGTFILDEPMAHLDDLNRVGLIDVFRSIAIEDAGRCNVLVTTSSRSLTRHLAEKFARVGESRRPEGGSTMRVIELAGNARSGVRKAGEA